MLNGIPKNQEKPFWDFWMTPTTATENVSSEDGNAVKEPRRGSLDLVAGYYSSIRKIPLLTAEEEKQAALAARSGDIKARNKLISSNLRLVVSIAKNYRSDFLSMADLIEEGNLGLFRAVDKFDPDRGFRFTTYATNWIKQSIESAIKLYSRTVRLPVHVTQATAQVLRARDRLQQQNEGRRPTCAEIAAAVSMPESKVEKLLAVYEQSGTVNPDIRGKSEDDNDLSVFDSIPDTSIATPEEALSRVELEEQVKVWFSALPHRKRVAVARYYGFNDLNEATLQEIGHDMGVSRERVRQLIMEVVKELRMNLRVHRDSYQ